MKATSESPHSVCLHLKSCVREACLALRATAGQAPLTSPWGQHGLGRFHPVCHSTASLVPQNEGRDVLDAPPQGSRGTVCVASRRICCHRHARCSSRGALAPRSGTDASRSCRKDVGTLKTSSSWPGKAAGLPTGRQGGGGVAPVPRKPQRSGVAHTCLPSHRRVFTPPRPPTKLPPAPLEKVFSSPENSRS